MYDFFSVEHWDRLWRLMLAQFVVLLLFVMDTMTFAIPMMDVARPTFFLIGIFYWAIYRPSLLPTVWIFVLGIIYDALLGFPIGLHSILFVFIQYLLRSQRLFFMGQSFITIWLGFSLAIALFEFCEWIVFSLLLSEIIIQKQIIFTFLFSALSFPIVSLALFLIHKILPVTQNHHFIEGSS